MINFKLEPKARLTISTKELALRGPAAQVLPKGQVDEITATCRTGSPQTNRSVALV